MHVCQLYRKNDSSLSYCATCVCLIDHIKAGKSPPDKSRLAVDENRAIVLMLGTNSGEIV